MNELNTLNLPPSPYINIFLTDVVDGYTQEKVAGVVFARSYDKMFSIMSGINFDISTKSKLL